MAVSLDSLIDAGLKYQQGKLALNQLKTAPVQQAKDLGTVEAPVRPGAAPPPVTDKKETGVLSGDVQKYAILGGLALLLVVGIAVGARR